MECRGMDAHNLDMIESGARCRTDPLAQQTHLTEITATRQVRQHHLISSSSLAYLHKSDPHQKKGISRLPFRADNLPPGITHQFHFVAELVDEIVGHGRKNRDTAQMRAEGAPPIICLKSG